MLGEFKSDQLFVEKTKLANNLYVGNLNHLSWHKPPTCAANNFKNKKKKIVSNFNDSLMLGEF